MGRHHASRTDGGPRSGWGPKSWGLGQSPSGVRGRAPRRKFGVLHGSLCILTLNMDMDMDTDLTHDGCVCAGANQTDHDKAHACISSGSHCRPSRADADMRVLHDPDLWSLLVAHPSLTAAVGALPPLPLPPRHVT